MEPRVWSMRAGAPKPPEPAVYVGRPSVWGNPYVRRGATSTFSVWEVDDPIAAYETWLLSQPKLMAMLPDLRGRHLYCWCAPKPCHGDVLLRLANPGVRPADAQLKLGL